MSYQLHWQAQRLTAVLMAFIYPFLLFAFYHLHHASYIEIIRSFSNPFLLIFIIIAISTALYHMVLGVRVIIEDYIRKPTIRDAFIKILHLKTILIFVFTVVTIVKIMILGSQL